MKHTKMTKLNPVERQMVALLCRLARAAKFGDVDPKQLQEIRQSLSDIEYEIRLHWNLRR